MEDVSEEACEVSRILQSAEAGEAVDLSRLLPLVYEEMRRIASRQMAGERRDHTLQTTALVHEAYLRLVGDGRLSWSSKAHFYSAAAQAMRRILVDHARARRRVKRGEGRVPLPVDLADLAAHDDPEEILAVDDAIRRLEEEDAQAARIVQLRFYAGLSLQETADVLGTPERTVRREWSYARVRLFRMLGREGRR